MSVVSRRTLLSIPTPGDPAKQESEVSELQDDVAHCVSPMNMFTVRSTTAKFIPVIVTEDCTLIAKFDGSSMVSTGPSKVKSA
jgi:hypothetical protein